MSKITTSQIILDIEEDVSTARDFANALALLSETFEEAQEGLRGRASSCR